MQLRKYLYWGFLAVSLILTVFTVIASVTGTSGTENSIFKSVWVVFILAAYVAIQLICLFSVKPQFTLHRCGFYMLHIGLILILTGSFVYYLSGDMVNVSVPVDNSSVYSEIRREKPDAAGNDVLKLGFGIGISDFEVERYTAEDGATGTDKYYKATLMIKSGGSGKIDEVPLVVNYPRRQNGWKIYLMNYDKLTESSVQLMMKNDPGEFVTLTGICLVIIGTFAMCLFRKKRSGDAV